jgi:hypothetical protein
MGIVPTPYQAGPIKRTSPEPLRSGLAHAGNFAGLLSERVCGSSPRPGAVRVGPFTKPPENALQFDEQLWWKIDADGIRV